MLNRVKTNIVCAGLALAPTGLAVRPAAAASEAFKYVAEVNGTGATSISGAQPGKTYQVDLFLQSSNVAAGSSLLAAANEDGLNGAGIKIALAAGTSQSSPAILSGPAAAAFNNNNAGSPEDFADFSGTGFSGQTVGPTLISFHEGLNPGAAAGVLFMTANAPSETTATQIYLGSVVVTAPSQAGTTNFTVGEYQASGSQTVTLNNAVDLDTGSQPFGTTYSFTPVGATTTPFSIATVTPEPSGLALLALGGLAALRRRRTCR